MWPESPQTGTQGTRAVLASELSCGSDQPAGLPSSAQQWACGPHGGGPTGAPGSGALGATHHPGGPGWSATLHLAQAESTSLTLTLMARAKAALPGWAPAGCPACPAPDRSCRGTAGGPPPYHSVSPVAQSCPNLCTYGPRHARPPCPSPTLRAYSNQCPLSR